MRTAILLLLPALAYGKIAVLVNFETKPPYVDIHGVSSDLITDQDRQEFKITDQQLKEAIANYKKEIPRDVFVKAETRYNLHKTYNWSEIRRNVKAKAKNFNVTCATRPWSTKLGFVNAVSQFDNNTPFLSENSVFTIQNEFGTVNKFESEWGNVTLYERRFSVPFQPANLTKCETSFDLEYVAKLTGDVVVNYNHERTGHYYWAFAIKNVQISNGLPTTVVRRATVKIRFGKPLPKPSVTVTS